MSTVKTSSQNKSNTKEYELINESNNVANSKEKQNKILLFTCYACGNKINKSLSGKIFNF